MPSQLEEIVVDAKAGDAEELLPEPRHQELVGRARRDMGRGDPWPVVQMDRELARSHLLRSRSGGAAARGQIGGRSDQDRPCLGGEYEAEELDPHLWCDGEAGFLTAVLREAPGVPLHGPPGCDSTAVEK